MDSIQKRCKGKMKKIIILFFVGLCLLFFSYQKAWCFNENETLAQARKMVEEKQYNYALEIYSKISNWLKNDPGLIIEQARVYTYADKHQEAIVLFEEVRSKYPEKEKEICFELAQQYKWNEEVKKSIPVYYKALDYFPADTRIELELAQALAWDKRHQEAIQRYNLILSKNPNDVQALLGKAEVLSWNDDLEEAFKIYKKVLELDPQNLNAANGKARVLVWQGYHLQGIKAYQEILKDNSDNIDAKEGMAYALHWQGDDVAAEKVIAEVLIQDPKRNSAKDLQYTIKNSRQPYVGTAQRFSSDKNKLRIFTAGSRGGMHLDSTTSLSALYERQYFRQYGHNPIFADREGVHLSKRFNDNWEANSIGYYTKFDFDDFDPFTNASWITFKPDDYLRFDVSYDRKTFEDMNALRKHILVNYGGFSMDFRPDRFWFFSAKYQRGSYNDNNTQDIVFSKVEYRLFHKPFIKAYYNYYFSDWKDQKDNGYFNPYSISSHSLGLYSGFNIAKKLFAELQGSYGYEQQNPNSDHPTCFAAFGLQYRLTQNWDFSVRGEYFSAEKDSHSNGYSKRSILASITYNFGASHYVYEATSPSRPVSGK